MATRLSTADHMTFTEGLSLYEYINKDGRLDLEDFCVTLASCILYDGIGYEEVAKPENFHNTLLQIIHERAPEGMAERWVQPQRIVDWAPQHAHLYPLKRRTCIHVAALGMYSADWISIIGSLVMDVPEEEWRPEYFGWAKEEWIFTHMFLAGFHNALWSFSKKMDLKWSLDGSTSMFEALQLSLKSNTGYDEATQKLEVRNKAWSSASARISKSIEDGYFLESITLSENFISNLLFNYLSSKGSVSTDLNFHTLIQKTKNLLKDADDVAIMERADSWRKSRNDAIHNFIKSSIDDLNANTDTFSSASKDTAQAGEELTKDMLIWYKAAAVGFIEHIFPRKNLDS